jgi:diguanylate cyclase (GGDEF)-like protein/PAS domain S-box-containing protein
VPLPIPAQINQVLMNLLVNAAQAIDDPTGTITLRSGHADRYAWFEVADDGVGMSPEVQKAHVRSLLHDQALGPGHRAWSVDLLGHHRAPQWHDQCRQHDGMRYALPDQVADRRGASRPGGRPMNGETSQEAFYDALGLVVVRVDARPDVWYVNAFGLRLLGYSHLGQVFKRPLIELLGVDSGASREFLAALRDIGSGGCVRNLETSVLASDGRRLWISWSIEQHVGADAILAPVLLVGADVTRTHERLESAVLFREIAQSNPLPIIITDANLSIVYSNPAVSAVTGYPADEILGSTPRIFRSGLTRDETFRSLWAALNAGAVWTGEFINQRKDGTIYTERKTISPIVDDQGRLRWYFSIGEDLSQQHALETRLAALTHCDALTGLRSRGGFMNALARLTTRLTAESNAEVAVVHIDIDDFESVNRLLGHDDADRLLVEIGRRLGDSVRGADVVARLGSDEFGLLLEVPESPSVHGCEEISGRLLAVIRPPFTIGERRIEVTPSIGIACFPVDGRQPGDLLARAVSATRRAKRSGGDTIIRFDPVLADEDSGRQELLGELRYAVASNQLVLHYQPQVSLQTGVVVGIEALVRWQHPEKGLVPPGRFIPAAEESGLIIAIGEWCLVEACRQMRQWLDAGFPPIKVAVNLSARHFHDTNLQHTVSDALAMHRLDAGMLELEITEGAMMYDVATAIHASERLKEIGVRLSLDDFGTGYSSLAYVSRFPIDLVKIDQSFVRDVTTNPSNAAIVQAIIAMSHKLGKEALAEGVETEEQMSYLRRSDCDEMQGFFFSRPLPADEIATLRRSRKRLHFGSRTNDGLPSLLLVDDEPNILSALNRLLRREGYRILLAGSADEALAILAREPVGVIVTDQRMPTMTGVEFLARVKTLYPSTVRLVLSGYSDVSAVTDAINKGAVYKYLNKPWDEGHLRSEIRDAFRMWKERFGKNDEG